MIVTELESRALTEFGAGDETLLWQVLCEYPLEVLVDMYHALDAAHPNDPDAHLETDSVDGGKLTVLVDAALDGDSERFNRTMNDCTEGDRQSLLTALARVRTLVAAASVHVSRRR